MKSSLNILRTFSAILLVIALIHHHSVLNAQTGSNDYDRFRIDDAKHIFSGLALSPDGKTLAVSGVQSYPFYLLDVGSREVVKKFDVGNWYAGSSVRYSKGGKYILVHQLYYIDFAPNKDREVNFEILDAASGKLVKRFEAEHAVTFTPDEQYALALSGGKVKFWNLATGKMDKSFNVPMASNGLAISPDGKTIAVSRHIDGKALKKDPRFKKKKKAAKVIGKYKQQISLYDAASFEPLKTIDEYYDIVYRLEYSRDGSKLFVLQIPHMKAQSAQQRLTYVNLIDATTYEPLRKGFTSAAPYEPDFKLSSDGKLFGIVSQGTRFVELHIYDFESGEMLRRFEESYRLFEKTDGEFLAADARCAFVFLPDNHTVVMTMGNSLIQWNLNLNN